MPHYASRARTEQTAAAALALPAIRGAGDPSGRDVLVHVEQIAGIVRPLDLDQSVVVLAVVVADLVVVVVLHEVDVAARLGVRRKRLVIVTHPLDPFGVLGGVGPGGEEDHAVFGVTVGKGGVSGPHAVAG